MNNTLQTIQRRINMQHFEALSRISKNTAKTLNVAPWAAELTDMLSKNGVNSTFLLNFMPTLLVELPKNGQPQMEQLLATVQAAGLNEWLEKNKLKYYGANSEYGVCIRIEPEADRLGYSDITIDIAAQPAK